MLPIHTHYCTGYFSPVKLQTKVNICFHMFCACSSRITQKHYKTRYRETWWECETGRKGIRITFLNDKTLVLTEDALSERLSSLYKGIKKIIKEIQCY